MQSDEWESVHGMGEPCSAQSLSMASKCIPLKFTANW